jgi:uncharacterized membrane protein YsdA (DUF1294 family)/cold shock CspA family protein
LTPSAFQYLAIANGDLWILMRNQGRIISWKDDQGFGFIAPKQGDGKIFVHIKDFANRGRRPVGNEDVTYELVSDQKGRARAGNVEFVGDRRRVASSRGTGWALLVFALLFIGLIAGAAYVGRLPVFVAGLYLVSSVAAFAAYAMDKSAARNDRRRIRENTLHMLGLIGGWPGALIAQRLLRHKSRKWSFQFGFWITVILNCGVLTWLYVPRGANAMRAIWRTITSALG